MVLRRLPILPDLAPDVAVHFGCFGGVREGATVNTPFLEHLSSSSLSPAQLAQAPRQVARHEPHLPGHSAALHSGAAMTLAAVCPPATATLSCSHPGCNYTTDRVNNLTRHERSHSGHSENGPAHWAAPLPGG